ncbi:hypothetical protein [uncultured Dokdonia sp.]|uniref:hypothetical protein n=1 Tax=uncultured Dokdonia sp. TaxID=575653 RepID=UPI0026114664|nr:hypothetical protein [uncultured Dokdonia sp.]
MKLSDIKLKSKGTFKTLSCFIDTFEDSMSFELSHFDNSHEHLLYDSFVIACIPLMIANKESLLVDGCVDTVLLKQLNTVVLPMLCKLYNIEDTISVKASKSVLVKTKGKEWVVTGLSCGVDSFTTIKTRTQKKQKLDALTFFDAGSHGLYGGKITQINYNYRLNNVENTANKLKLPLVKVRSNNYKFTSELFQEWHSFLNLSCVFATGGLIKKYYYASAYTKEKSVMKAGDTSNFDHYILPELYTSYLKVTSSVTELNRVERTRFIQDDALVRQHLDVCTNSIEASNIKRQNCTSCAKCLRTALTLDSLGVIEEFNNVFDLKRYHKNKNRYIASLLNSKTIIDIELVDHLKEEKKIHFKHYLLSIYLQFKNTLKKRYVSL